MESFVFEKHVKVYFGVDCVNRYLKKELDNYGKNVMLAYGGGSIKANGIYEQLRQILEAADKSVVEFNGIMPNPTLEKVKEGARLVKKKQIDLILAVGGGSVLDCCKIVSAQGKTDRDLWEMQFGENVFSTEFIPMIAIVTAAGTGSEMNAYAVITNDDEKIKATMIGTYPDMAFLDPSYTQTLPLNLVLAGAFDTLSHCMETYFGLPMDNNLSDEMNEAVMRSVIRNTQAVMRDPTDLNLRSELMWASSMAENSILKIGKMMAFQAHQIEHQLGAYTNCNHGQGLAVIQPVMYRRVLEEGLDRFARFAINVWGVSADLGSPQQIAHAGIDALVSFVYLLELPTTLRELGVGSDVDLRSVADSCNIVTGGCFRTLTHDEIFELLVECY